MRMRVSNPRSSFGMKCVQCSNELIAPERSEGAVGKCPQLELIEPPAATAGTR